MNYVLDNFIVGEKIDLKIPTEDFAKNSNWYKLINSQKNNKYLDYGIFPNTANDQINFLRNSKKEGRLVFVVFDKKNNFLGAINLSNINLEKRSGEIALVFNLDKNFGHVTSNMLASLEAIALMTKHAFENLNIHRISAGQSIYLERWQNLMELVGYKIEGIQKKKFIKNNNFSDVITISCLRNDYDSIKKTRGELWDSSEKMLKRIKKLPKETAYKKLRSYLDALEKDYYKKIIKL